MSPGLSGGFFTTEPPGKACILFSQHFWFVDGSFSLSLGFFLNFLKVSSLSFLEILCGRYGIGACVWLAIFIQFLLNNVSMCVSVSVCMCVCVWVRQRERFCIIYYFISQIIFFFSKLHKKNKARVTLNLSLFHLYYSSLF